MSSATAGTGDTMGGQLTSPTAPRTALILPARPDSVAIARNAIAELGTDLELSERKLADLRTIVSEACMNAAIHAYDRPGGDFEVIAEGQDDGGLAVNVRDRGDGIKPRPAIGAATARLGLLLIATLAQSTEIRSRPGGGTDLRIFLAPEAG